MSRSNRFEFWRFVVAGGTAAAVNVACRSLLNLFMSYEIAIVIAYGCGMLTAFALSKYFVFSRSNRATGVELARFTLVNLFALAQVWLISVGLAEWLFPRTGFNFHPHTVAHMIGVAAPVFTSYFGHKKFSFSLGTDAAERQRMP